MEKEALKRMALGNTHDMIHNLICGPPFGCALGAAHFVIIDKIDQHKPSVDSLLA